MSDRKIGLDYVRSVAILLVVTCHLANDWYQARPAYIFPLGVLGVELFFVLSGFLIGGIFLKQTVANGNRVTPNLVLVFWARRWLRTVPNYLLFLIVFAVLLPSTPSWSAAAYLTFTQNLAWPIPPFYSVSWSLCVEEWFYLLFPVLCLIAFTVTGRVKYAFLTAALLLFVTPIGLRIAIGRGQPWDDGVRKIVAYRLDAIMWGVLLAAAHRYRPDLFLYVQRRWVGIAGWASCLLCCLWLAGRYAGEQTDFLSRPDDTLIFCAFSFSAALVVASASASGSVLRFLDRAALLTSLWSYSMYLCHIPVLIGLMSVARRLTMLYPSVAPPREAWVAATVAAIYAVSAATYYGFESPILRMRDRWTGHRQTKA
ncbi:acyltransferase family protein [Limnoglobus roseus]|uniref:Acyltransferase n=1 Tax=Limnoglobus roseus TaxID=2598579 RepID=A0A5C1AIN7_9BACT|nr:acyltransferase [Limnoglobus roseus]QEL18515.1 acyltransferase [Limnoglobus roseus]